MIKGFLNLPWFLWATLALILSILWVYVGPHTKLKPAPGFLYFIVRWGHALTWLFLAVSFALRGIGPDLNGGSSFFALAGGVMYILFMAMTFVLK
jgi:drug/metabolite transporter (DMT)-like permease